MENVNPIRKFTTDNNKKQKNTVLKNTTSFLSSNEDKFSYGVNSQNKIQEKQVSIDNLKINYKQIGDGNVPIILLHGWGVSSDKYLELGKYLSQFSIFNFQFSIIIPDLPGFGKSDVPREAWGVDEYAELVRKLTKLLFCHPESASPLCHSASEASGRMKDSVANDKNILIPRDSSVAWLPQNDNKKEFDKFILIGHSFGGQIAIKFAAKYPEKLKALILTGAAGIRHSPTIKQRIFYYFAKIGKIIFSLPLINRLEKSAQGLLYRAAREKDYYQAKGIMKEIFKKVIKEDLTGDLIKITTSTLLIWGRNDHSTPLKDGEMMHFEIRNSKLEILDDSDHRAPYQFPEKFAKIILEFIKK